MDRDFSFSDDDDDEEEEEGEKLLIMESNERKPPPSTLQIKSKVVYDSCFKNNTVARFFRSHKRYLFAIISLPILLIALYFSMHNNIGNLFPSNHFPIIPNDVNTMREAELRSLHLLRDQQLGLFKIWNHSISNSTIPNFIDDDFRSALLKQLALNKEVQQVLLSSHRLGSNLSAELDNADAGFGNYYYGLINTCRKVDSVSYRRTVEWNPNSNKFLFAICLSGQMSNHLICLEKHMFFAAILGRVLVLPSPKFDFQYNRVIDIDHINKCLGRKAVLTFEEFSELKKNHMHIDKVVCYVSSPQPCYVDEDHVKKLKSLGVSMAKLEPAWVEDIKEPKKRTIEDVKSKFSTNDDVLAIGDVFYADVEKEWVMQPGGPIAHNCKTLIEPNRYITLTAQRFIQTFLGQNFVALHFRRHGFLKFCNEKKPSCFFPIPQAADCIARVVERANSPVIYLSTDAAESETDLLQSLVVLNGKIIPLVKRPARNSAEKWDALLYRHGLAGDPQVEAMLDKTICAMSNVFIGSPGSTFTDDIIRLRKDWRSASACDEYLCQSELPNFVAENE
ncbi:hypothetical protein Sjap_024206 [Stephania japonica]|uniref:GDP-fucose protein O-fucosyltransferase 2 n=1 Tax=Stephania japonica TaxID=461633 RepID=A0AAP0ELM6_9MAGN